MLEQLAAVLSDAFVENNARPVTGAEGEGGSDETAKRLPEMLTQRVRNKLAELTNVAVSELKSYHKPPAAVTEVRAPGLVLRACARRVMLTVHRVGVPWRAAGATLRCGGSGWRSGARRALRA
jgi:hypothetical protein